MFYRAMTLARKIHNFYCQIFSLLFLKIVYKKVYIIESMALLLSLSFNDAR